LSAAQTTTTKAPETVPFSCPPDHAHKATSACYKTHKCRCQPCRDGVAKRERTRRASFANGVRRREVDPAAATAHIATLLEARMTQRDIAARAGLSELTVRNITKGKVPWIFATTERALLAVKPARSIDAGQRVDGTGTRRRMQALMALGYSTTELSARLHKPRPFASRVMRQEFVVEPTRIAVAALYDELSMTKLPDTWEVQRIRNIAAKNGYAPPLAWDDDVIDDPSAEPAEWKRGATERGFLTRNDEAVILAALDGDKPEMSPVERREVITKLNARRWSAGRIGAYIDCSVKTVDRVRGELELPVYDQSELRGAA
jgi:DNA-binding XRE family transcriptional regulator